MAVDPPPLVGFNNNVRYRGQRFHIQTEDSGVRRPHIATHLFADGGHIIKSMRSDYAEHVERSDRAVVVRKMMMDQHKAMAIALRRGSLDELLSGLSESNDATPKPVLAGALSRLVPGTPPSEVPHTRLISLPSVAERNLQAPLPGHAPPQPIPSDRASASGEHLAPHSETMNSLRPFPPDEQAPLHIALANPACRPSQGPPSLKQLADQAINGPLSGVPATQTSPETPPLSPQKPVGRPSLRTLREPNGASLFGTEPERCLDDAILGYLSTHSKRTTDKNS